MAEKQFTEILAGTDQWNWDVFELLRVSEGRPLLFLGMALFQKYDLIGKFNIDRSKLCNFLAVIESGYHLNNPHHNSTHAADVTRSMHFFLTTGNVKSCCDDSDILAAIVAAVILDYDHPGRTNAFQIATSDYKSILYNDRNVLENHHCAQAFLQLQKEENNIFKQMEKRNFSAVRKTVLEMVLATDISTHFETIGHFSSTIQPGKMVNEKSRLLILKMALKCADLGDSAKIITLHRRWAERRGEEFFQQGDDERKRGLPISPFMDRQKATIPQAQLGFMDFLVIPMFNVWCTFLQLPEDTFPCMKQLKENRDHWKTQFDDQTVKKAAGAGALAATTVPSVPSVSTTSTASAPAKTTSPP